MSGSFGGDGQVSHGLQLLFIANHVSSFVTNIEPNPLDIINAAISS